MLVVDVQHWRTFLAELHAEGEGERVPAWIEAEFEAFLRCGVPAHGFALVKCSVCGLGKPVPLSCQRRGFCPSCIGRRMADFAARLTTRVLRRVAMRQWVLTVPHRLRAALAVDRHLRASSFDRT